MSSGAKEVKVHPDQSLDSDADADSVTVKMCKECQEYRDVKEFLPRRNDSDGLRTVCNICLAERRSGTKKCKGKCQNELPSDHFHTKSSSHDGLEGICKLCIGESKTARREEAAEWRRTLYAEEYKSRCANPSCRAEVSYDCIEWAHKSRANKNRREFTNMSIKRMVATQHQVRPLCFKCHAEETKREEDAMAASHAYSTHPRAVASLAARKRAKACVKALKLARVRCSRCSAVVTSDDRSLRTFTFVRGGGHTRMAALEHRGSSNSTLEAVAKLCVFVCASPCGRQLARELRAAAKAKRKHVDLIKMGAALI